MREFIITRRDGSIHIVQLDDEDYDRVIAAGPWYIKVMPGVLYAYRDTETSTQYLHRFILGDACVGKLVDHADGNGLNNQRNNLRACTKAENMRNRGAQLNNTSGFKGVSWCKQKRRWYAQIVAEEKRQHLGFFDTAEEAHAAYCEAAARLHGEFARFK